MSIIMPTITSTTTSDGSTNPLVSGLHAYESNNGSLQSLTDGIDNGVSSDAQKGQPYLEDMNHLRTTGSTHSSNTSIASSTADTFNTANKTNYTNNHTSDVTKDSTPIGHLAHTEPQLDVPLGRRTMFDVVSYRPDYDIQVEYRSYIANRGIRSFLNKYIPENITKVEICELILDLGYGREYVQDYEMRTTREIAGILVTLLSEDLKLKMPLTKPIKESYTIKRFFNDLTTSAKVLIITGAGISTSLGIPDFRSFQGLYNQLSHLHLKDPQLVFDINEFNKRPETFYSIAHLILPPEGRFSVMHAFIRLLQDRQQLLRNYTQNIDNLEYYAGIDPTRLIQCHGSFGTASCLTCRNRFAGPKIFNHIRHKQIPRCSACWKNTQEAAINYGVIKPDITFFGEDLPKKFYKSINIDCKKCDLVLVIGTSLKVEPVASIIDRIPRRIPRVLINKDPLPDRDFDLTLLGLSDTVASHICSKLGPEWFIPHEKFQSNITTEFVPHASLPQTFDIV